jgi:plasmid replication initiation protein
MDHKLVVYKANPLINASFKLNLNEQRLILACIAQITDPRKSITRDDEFTITAPAFSRLFGMSPKSAYADLSEAATSLLARIVVIEQPDPDNPSLSRTKTGWVSSADYYDGQGKVVIKFRDAIIPYLSNLKNGCFSKYKIEQIAKLKSVYAIRLYEIFVSESWKDKLCEIDIDTLKKMFQLHGEYERVFDFKKFVIKPAIESINANTDIQVSYTPKKTGRSVTHFIFAITKDKVPEKPKKSASNGAKKYSAPLDLTEQQKQAIAAQLDAMTKEIRARRKN